MTETISERPRRKVTPTRKSRAPVKAKPKTVKAVKPKPRKKKVEPEPEFVVTVEEVPPVPLAHIQDEELIPVSDEVFEAHLRTDRQRRRLALSAAAVVLLAAVIAFSWPHAEATPLEEAPSGRAPIDAAPISLDTAWNWPSTAATTPPLRPAIDVRVDVSARLERAQKFYAAERLREAQALLDEAVALAPENFEAWLLRGEVQFDLGDRQHARESAECALELMPLDARVHLFRATLALDAGDVAAARSALQSVLAIDADSAEGVEARAILERLDRRRRG